MIIHRRKKESPRNIFVFYKEVISEANGLNAIIFFERMTRLDEHPCYWTLVAKNGKRYKDYSADC